MSLEAVWEILSATLVLSGALLAFSAAVGLVRFRDTLSRMHAVTKPQTLGLVLATTGAIIHVIASPQAGVNEHSDIGILVLVIVFALLTSPVIAQRVGRVARKEGLVDSSPAHLVHDDTAKQSEPKRPDKPHQQAR